MKEVHTWKGGREHLNFPAACAVELHTVPENWYPKVHWDSEGSRVWAAIKLNYSSSPLHLPYMTREYNQ